MFVSVKSLTALMDERMALIESNKTAPVSEEEILKVNDEILKLLQKGLEELKRVSCNKKVIEKYTKLISNIKVI